MGGIACIYGPSPTEQNLKNMVRKISHRGNIQNQLIYNTKVSNKPPSILFDGTLTNQDRSYYGETDAELALRLFDENEFTFHHRLKGAYALIIRSRRKGIFLARDPLGIIPLYCCKQDRDWYFASEIKAFPDDAEIFTILPGTCCRLIADNIDRYNTQYVDKWRPESLEQPRDEIESRLRLYLTDTISQILKRSTDVGVYLSGGLDSSIIAAILSKEINNLPTFAVGMKNSDDLHFAKLCANEFKTDHYEYEYSQREMIEVLPEVIYHLESYDTALVRSSVPNYILARFAKSHIRNVLSGEGADELFWGYNYMRNMSFDELTNETTSLLKNMHNIGLRRGDRMSSAFGIQARPPFLTKKIVRLALGIPPKYKISPKGIEKWILRTAFTSVLPSEITDRKKQKFSQGSGSFHVLEEYAKKMQDNIKYGPGSLTRSGYLIKTWEEGLYYDIFQAFFPNKSADITVGHTKHVQ